MDDTGGPQAMYDALPFVTKHWLTATVCVTVLANFGAISVGNLIWDYRALSEKFEVWRLVTPFLFAGGFSFQMVILIFLLYQYSRQYESSSMFNTGGGGGTADYVFMMMFGMIGIVISGALLGLGVIFSQALVYYVLYIWSKRHPTAQSNLWGFPIQANFLPFALLAINILMGNAFVHYLHGYAIGHIYYFIVDVVPKVYGKTILTTPEFLISKFGVGEYIPPAPERNMGAAGNNTWQAPGRANPPNDVAAARGYNWGGGGQALGRN